MNEDKQQRELANTDRETAERLAEKKLEDRHEGLLPGIVAVGGWMIITAMVGLVSAAQGVYPNAGAKAAVVAIAGLLLTGSVGMLLLRRWGWALVLSASVLSSAYFLFVAIRIGQTGGYIMAALQMVFFLYLVRPEVRARMR